MIFTSLGRNFSKLVTAGTVGTLSVTGRWLGWGWNLVEQTRVSFGRFTLWLHLCYSSPPGLGISKAESGAGAAYLVSVTLIVSLGICPKRLSNQSKLGASVSDSEPLTTLPAALL